MKLHYLLSFLQIFLSLVAITSVSPIRNRLQSKHPHLSDGLINSVRVWAIFLTAILTLVIWCERISSDWDSEARFKDVSSSLELEVFKVKNHPLSIKPLHEIRWEGGTYFSRLEISTPYAIPIATFVLKGNNIINFEIQPVSEGVEIKTRMSKGKTEWAQTIPNFIGTYIATIETFTDQEAKLDYYIR